MAAVQVKRTPFTIGMNNFLSVVLVALSLRLGRAWIVTPHLLRNTRRASVLHFSLRRQYRPNEATSSRRSITHTSRLWSSAAERQVDGTLETATEDSRKELSLEDFATLPHGIPKGFFVVKQYPIPKEEDFNWSGIDIDGEDADRLGLTTQNISLPVALMIADPLEFPSLSRARKACRKGNILVHQGPLCTNEDTGEPNAFDPSLCIRGRVGDRIVPGDVIAKQVRMGSGYFPVLLHEKPFDVPVIYEDDHWALVNKPAGVAIYDHRNGGDGLMTVRAALPFVLTPPAPGTCAVMRRPASVHRLDKPTSGILCVAKTKPAMMNLSRQFHDRIVKKTYFAIVNGIPPESKESTISTQEAYELGVDVDPNEEGDWQLIDSPLDDKSAVTVWRSVRYAKSLHAMDGHLTLVEMKPKTGRYHQLRRHMAWVCERPLIGDDEYDEGTEPAMKFPDRGLFLCSTRISLEHPYYNSPEGRQVWENLADDRKDSSGKIWLSADDTVMVTATIDLPNQFENLLKRSEERHDKFAAEKSQ